MKWRKRWLKLLLTAGLLVFLFRQFEVKASELVTGMQDWALVAAACLLPLTVMPLIAIGRWKLFLNVSGIHESVFTLWRINWIAMFQGLVLPSSQGFDLLRFYHIERRHPDKRGLAGSTVLVERMIGAILLCVLSLAAMYFLADTRAFLPLALTIAGMTAVVFGSVGLVLSERLHALYAGRHFSNPWLDRIFSYLESLHRAVIRFPYGKVLAISIILIACLQLCAVASVYLIFRAYGYDIHFVQHVALYPVITVLSMAPVTIGGFGVREGLFVYFYSLLGVPADVAIGVSILNYVILLLIPSLFGGLFCLWDALTSAPPQNTPSGPTEGS